MNDLWKVWRQVFPREAIVGGFLILILASFMIHVVVMLGSDRYITGLLG